MTKKDSITLINDINLYDKGTHVMWTDPYISKQLLEMHLNPAIEVASRKPALIDHTIDWMLKESSKETKNILDLGCGPGLYTKRLAERGYNVTGIDFSPNSINYAKEEAIKHNLEINYICQNYLEIDFEETYDLIMMIYWDFGVLSPKERTLLLEKIYKALKPGGCFLFDIPNAKYAQNKTTSKDWEISNGGFWSPNPYTCLSASIPFPEDKVILDQHLVIDEMNDHKLYRFWQHYFTKEDVSHIASKAQFKTFKEYEDILEPNSIVNFYKLEK